MTPTRTTPLTYWRRVARFALLGRTPATPHEVPTWALALPFRLWNEVVRYDGRTFEDLQTAGVPPLARRLLPLRALYLAFLFLWPFVAFARSLRRGRRLWGYYTLALGYPELAVFHPKSDYTEREAAWTRPDFSLGMLYAWLWHRSRAPWLALDDKRRFLAVCAERGLPTPPTLSPSEAVAKGGEFIVKDPQRDLGFGVVTLTSGELRELGDAAGELIVQRRLRNHPALLKALPETAPLSSFRVITTLDPATREPRVSRCAVRIGRAGAVADNTAQGGIWAQVDRETGAILPGVTRKTFGTYKEGVRGNRRRNAPRGAADGAPGTPVRFAEHPDTGRAFAGIVVPWFDEGRRMALDAHRALAPEAPSLGWDVALAASGPVFLEVNVWTTCYDYDPPDDAFTPACTLVLAALAASATRKRLETSASEY